MVTAASSSQSAELYTHPHALESDIPGQPHLHTSNLHALLHAGATVLLGGLGRQEGLQAEAGEGG